MPKTTLTEEVEVLRFFEPGPIEKVETVLAALNLSRNFIGIEINSDYIEFAQRRIASCGEESSPRSNAGAKPKRPNSDWN